MSLNGSGGDGKGPLPPDRIVVRPGPPLLTPEQTCLGCGLGLLAILLAALFWGYYFWRLSEQENAPKPRRSSSAIVSPYVAVR